ncbi:ketosteroid isomerase [Mangrovimicrobium sediminis]|uniref:Ketosteroid isomerase n=1 Tax=Mangrovimicrobium sediminis TaxID=2562682 RepID=A0A4Z0LV39_9GAMM|nr:nuclear transport factor 2 family protein [Haliea sp. SAOS-164]TGD71114.1 ketosteroid isomerase [Haliea sp. SAOS-164]
MDTAPLHQLARNFFAAVGRGHLPEDLVTPDMTAWVLSSGDSDLARFNGGIALLAALVEPGKLVYEIQSITAEEDRVVAEVSSDWPLVNGQHARNDHVFAFRVRDGRIAHVAEYMDTRVTREIIGPAIQVLAQQLAAQKDSAGD